VNFVCMCRFVLPFVGRCDARSAHTQCASACHGYFMGVVLSSYDFCLLLGVFLDALFLQNNHCPQFVIFHGPCTFRTRRLYAHRTSRSHSDTFFVCFNSGSSCFAKLLDLNLACSDRRVSGSPSPSLPHRPRVVSLLTTRRPRRRALRLPTRNIFLVGALFKLLYRAGSPLLAFLKPSVSTNS
jgi:hypothetical protein